MTYQTITKLKCNKYATQSCSEQSHANHAKINKDVRGKNFIRQLYHSFSKYNAIVVSCDSAYEPYKL